VGGSPEAGSASRLRAFALAALVLAVVAALDQATKALALASLAPGQPESVFFGLDLSVSRNTGIAFGALAGAGDAVIVALVAIAVGVLLVFFAARADRPLLWLPIGMVLGGAAGNLIDRGRIGAVVDFIDPSFWPAFNLADMSIVLGVLGVLYVAEGRKEEPEATRGTGEEGASAAPSSPRPGAGRPRAGGESAHCHDSS
jgi:signal peptidase II